MKQSRLSGVIVLALFASLLMSCGSGGGDTGGRANEAVAVLTLMTSGPSTTVYGVDVTIDLPAGATVRSTVAPPETDAGVVTATGPAASISTAIGMYSEATSSLPARVRVEVASAAGFPPGEFGKVNCDLIPGFMPSAGDFGPLSFSVVDKNGSTLPGLTVGFTVDIR